jgi:hypothetical protein
MVPGIAMAETGRGEGLAIVGSLLTAGAMAVFLVNLVVNVLLVKGRPVAEAA